MEFLTFEDETGIVETTFFPRIYEKYCHLLASGRPYLLTGLVEENFGVHTLTVQRMAGIKRSERSMDTHQGASKTRTHGKSPPSGGVVK